MKDRQRASERKEGERKGGKVEREREKASSPFVRSALN